LDEIYDYFLLRHSQHLLAEAGKMLAQMKVDVAKGLVPIIVASSMKDTIRSDLTGVDSPSRSGSW
jgi:hypothetical protein